MTKMIEVSEDEYIALMLTRGIQRAFTLLEHKVEEVKIEELKKEFDELRRYETFMDNHPMHEIEIKSYSEGKGSSFKTNISKANMKKIASSLMEENLAKQKAANEQIARYKGARKCQC